MRLPHYKDRKHDLGRRLLTLRDRIGLTQSELAALIGVNRRSILNWEAGASYPRENHLEPLIAVYLERGGFTPGREREEAEALWEQASQDASRPLSLFDVAWFEQLLATRASTPSSTNVFPPTPRIDRGEATGR